MSGLVVDTHDSLDIQSAIDLARVHGLSFYDAVYLELAKRKNAKLATLDAALGHAALVDGVRLLDV